MSDEKPSPAWGYHKTKGAKLFEDGNLPAGYADTPHPGQHPHDVDGTNAADVSDSKGGDI